MSRNSLTRRLDIEQAALDLFAERGFTGTGIRDIASRVGIVTSALYHYVGTKEELLAAIMRRGLHAAIEAAQAVLSLADAPEDRMAILVQAHVAMQLFDPRTSNVVDGEVRHLQGEFREEIVQIRDRYEAIWSDEIASGLRDRTFNVSDPKLARLGLLEMCNGVSRWFRPTRRMDVARVGASFADLALGALRAQRGGRNLALSDLSVPAPGRIVELVERIVAAPATSQPARIPA